MAEWRPPLPLQPPPGSVEPEPTLDTPGWDAWAYNVARSEAATVPGAKTPPDFAVKMIVTVGPETWFVRSGEDPGPWQDDHATVETRPPADYADWRRFRRVYPRITYYVGREVRVELHLVLPPAAGARVRYFLFHEIRSGPTVARDVIQRHWVRTSMDRTPDNSGVTYREENWDELDTIPAPIPNGELPSKPTPRPRELEEWQPAAGRDDPSGDKPKMKPGWGLELKWDWIHNRLADPLLDAEYARWRTAQEIRRRLGQNPKPPRPRETDYDGDADEATRAEAEAHGQ